MVGFVIATHGKLASGFLDAVKLIIGEQENIGEIGLFEGNDVSEFGLKLEKLIRQEDEGDGVIVFTDLFAASPYNQAALCASRIKNVKIQLITGVNLPMIIEAINARMMGQNIEQITNAAFETAKVGIKNFWDELNAHTSQTKH
ncbi:MULTISPECIES: PTS sugar transporter subunit IIA [Lacticaseibacillus]|uniref:PTS mannose transporter subunit IID n=2 Tax=Lacticaseibacillus TaxID=2759736 RepID=A0AAN1KFH1_LACCA|nr:MULTISPECIES: PTS sugar transporter subunit IIA [Lacticaseibacillus]ARY92753.1 PTS mannose transporter subunit IID [Lacticaseibacillus casei]KAB1967621.1 PTS sugar transporter subunit IIA [Lacticaseibacillus casei]WLV80644.1 PTS sugar transporter subunit IIA [Lacticaseibacillus sp. NCIMB 15473]WNX24614.1 PTS sugar transporter subunit IIA [Lacticaseibacillus casei]WNX27376.1 PTS sugar transporter subunit IIA [Lacticaseibacillus casei]